MKIIHHLASTLGYCIRLRAWQVSFLQISLLALVSNLLFSQNLPSCRTFPVTGLSQNTVKCIIQDRQGYIWVGTDDGLNRFDGYQFKFYKNKQSNPNSLSNNVIHSLLEDKMGFLWVGTANGLNRFDPSQGTFRQFHHDPNNPKSISSTSIYSVFEDKEGILWAGTSTTLDQYNRTTGEFEHFLPPIPPPAYSQDNAIISITEFGNDLYICTWGSGIWRFQKRSKRFERIFTENEASEPFRWASRIWAETDGGFYAILNDFVFKYKADRGVFSKLPFNRYGKLTLTTSFHKISDGKWLAGTSGSGMVVYGPDFTQLATYPLEPDPLLANYNVVTSLFRDNCGLFWIGTRGNGLFTLDLENTKFHPLNGSAGSPKGPAIKDITCILEARPGEIWLANKAQGIFFLDSASQTPFPISQRRGFPTELDVNEVKVLFQDSRQRVWVGTWGNGLFAWDAVNRQILHFKLQGPEDQRLTDNFITALCEAKDGRVWVSTSNGVSVIEAAGGRVSTSYLYENGHPKGLSHPRANVVFCDQTGTIWIGTGDGGLNRYDANNDRFFYFKHDPYDPATLGSNRVTCLFEDHANRLWVGTYGGGLHRLEADSGRFTHFKEKDGAPSDIILGMTEAPNGTLWLSTNKGLVKFDTETSAFTNFSKDDGLAGNQFNERAITKSQKTGEIYVGGIQGASYFHPDSIYINPYLPPVVISSIKKYVTEGNQTLTMDIEAVETPGQIIVPFSENTLTFEFAALNYRQSMKNSYAYKLEGLDRNWNDLGTKREVTFGNLPSGKYTLRVKASNNDGVWNNQGTSLSIHVLHPWYRTWWAYLIYTSAVIGLFYFLRKKELTEQQLKHRLELEFLEAAKLKEVDHLKSRFFANISHEFRTPLTLILGQIESTKERIGDASVLPKLDMALRNGKRLLLLINQLLDLSKLEAGNMQLHTKQKDLIPFLKNICHSFDSLAEQRGINLEFQCELPALPMYFDENKLEKVFFNLLSNALQFTPEGGKVAMITEPTDAPFLVKTTVRDTGIGIPAERLPFVYDRFYQVDGSHTRENEGTGIGLALVKELVELHSGRIEAKSQEGAGTAFTVFLTYGQPTENGVETPAPLAGTYLTVPTTADIEPNTAISQKNNAPPSAMLLVVEDNPDLRHYLKEHLIEAGYQVLETANGEQGLAAAQSHLPDLILTDVMMPRMDGFEFSRRIRSDERTSHIPIIMLTAKAGEQDKIEGLQTGVDDYLTKPFSSRELLVRVANLISLRQQLRQRFSTATVIRPSEVSAITADQAFLKKVIEEIEKEISNEQFGLEPLSQSVHISPTHLNRKLNALIGQSAGQLIRSVRLKRAADLLAQNGTTIKEVAFQVGFSVPENFSRSFKKQFGCTPGEYQKKSEMPAVPPEQ